MLTLKSLPRQLNFHLNGSNKNIRVIVFFLLHNQLQTHILAQPSVLHVKLECRNIDKSVELLDPPPPPINTEYNLLHVHTDKT